MDAFSYATAGRCFSLPIKDTMNNTAKNSEISNRKLKPASISRKRPPRNGPVKLPKLKNIPHSKFPVGSNCLGVKSDMYEIPSEKIDPAKRPAMKNIAITAVVEVSTVLAMKNEIAPPPSAIRKTGLLPILSDNIPSGNCEIIPPTENDARITDTDVNGTPLRSAYTGYIAFSEDSRKPYPNGPKNASHPTAIVALNRMKNRSFSDFPLMISGKSFFNKKTSDHASMHNKPDTMNGKPSNTLTSGANKGPAANPAPNDKP